MRHKRLAFLYFYLDIRYKHKMLKFFFVSTFQVSIRVPIKNQEKLNFRLFFYRKMMSEVKHQHFLNSLKKTNFIENSQISVEQVSFFNSIKNYRWSSNFIEIFHFGQ